MSELIHWDYIVTTYDGPYYNNGEGMSNRFEALYEAMDFANQRVKDGHVCVYVSRIVAKVQTKRELVLKEVW